MESYLVAENRLDIVAAADGVGFLVEAAAGLVVRSVLAVAVEPSMSSAAAQAVSGRPAVTAYAANNWSACRSLLHILLLMAVSVGSVEAWYAIRVVAEVERPSRRLDSLGRKGCSCSARIAAHKDCRAVAAIASGSSMPVPGNAWKGHPAHPRQTLVSCRTCQPEPFLVAGSCSYVDHAASAG